MQECISIDTLYKLSYARVFADIIIWVFSPNTCLQTECNGWIDSWLKEYRRKVAWSTRNFKLMVISQLAANHTDETDPVKHDSKSRTPFQCWNNCYNRLEVNTKDGNCSVVSPHRPNHSPCPDYRTLYIVGSKWPLVTVDDLKEWSRINQR